MTDRGRVIYDIERCICHVPDACRDCSKYKGAYTPDCMERLLGEALELLKVQEPRLMTLEEVIAHYSLPPVFVDDLSAQEEYLHDIEPLYFEYKIDKSWAAHWRDYQSTRMYLDDWKESYGERWRCWTARPTDEQRQAVKWDEGQS